MSKHPQLSGLNDLINESPFSLNKRQKDKILEKVISNLTRHHYENCSEYRRILNILQFEPNENFSIDKVPPIPVRLFKEFDLLSVERSKIIKTLTSSGTTGQSVSKIFLDKITSTNQSKVLTKIVSDFIGSKRMPMLVIDTKAVIKDRNLFSARGAGILGFSLFGSNVTYALNENMVLDYDVVDAFCKKYKDQDVLIFGFTFMIWKYFCKELERRGISLPLEHGVMIHGGGWKKMTEDEVDNQTFKSSIKHVCGINRVHNYYGMVEQTGSIFIECEKGYLHSSIFSDIKILKTDFSIADFGETGLVQLSSLLPVSYPGHILLSEDEGEIIGEDDCSCGRLGKYFMIHGRVMNAEIRGCSDTHD